MGILSWNSAIAPKIAMLYNNISANAYTEYTK